MVKQKTAKAFQLPTPHHVIVDMTTGTVAEYKNGTLRIVYEFGGGFTLPPDFGALPLHKLTMDSARRHPDLHKILAKLSDKIDFTTKKDSMNIVTATGFRVADDKRYVQQHCTLAKEHHSHSHTSLGRSSRGNGRGCTRKAL